MIQKSKTPICDKAEKMLVNRHEVVYLHVAQKLEIALIKARKQLKVFKDSEKRQRKWDEIERIEDPQDYYREWT